MKNNWNENGLTGYPSIDKPWLKYYSEEAINAPLPKCTMYEYIFNSNQDNLKRTAMSYYGKNISYRQMFKQISLMAWKLEHIGIKNGDVVTVAMINSPETIMLMFALNKIGAVANMVYGSSTSEELKKYMLDSKSTFVFTLDMFQDKFLDIADDIHITTVVVTDVTRSMSLLNKIGAQWIKGLSAKPLPDDSRFISWDNFFNNNECSKTTLHDTNAPAIIVYTGERQEVLKERCLVIKQ